MLYPAELRAPPLYSMTSPTFPRGEKTLYHHYITTARHSDPASPAISSAFSTVDAFGRDQLGEHLRARNHIFRVGVKF